MVKRYSKFLDYLETVEKVVLAVSAAVMVIVMLYQVILRYCFTASNSWSEELARYLFIYDVLIASSIAIRKNSHLQVDFLINLLKPKQKALFTAVTTLAAIVFLVFLFCYSITLCQASMRSTSVGLGISMMYPYTCLPVGSVLMILTSIEVVLKNLAIVRQKDEGVSEG